MTTFEAITAAVKDGVSFKFELDASNNCVEITSRCTAIPNQGDGEGDQWLVRLPGLDDMQLAEIICRMTDIARARKGGILPVMPNVVASCHLLPMSKEFVRG